MSCSLYCVQLYSCNSKATAAILLALGVDCSLLINQSLVSLSLVADTSANFVNFQFVQHNRRNSPCKNIIVHVVYVALGSCLVGIVILRQCHGLAAVKKVVTCAEENCNTSGNRTCSYRRCRQCCVRHANTNLLRARCRVSSHNKQTGLSATTQPVLDTPQSSAPPLPAPPALSLATSSALGSAIPGPVGGHEAPAGSGYANTCPTPWQCIPSSVILPSLERNRQASAAEAQATVRHTSVRIVLWSQVCRILPSFGTSPDHIIRQTNLQLAS